jgi:hypothetical protein
MQSKFKVRPLVSAVFGKLNDKLFSYMQRTGLVLSVAHTAVEPATGSTYGVSATIPVTHDAAGYAATAMAYALVGGISDFPEFDLTRAVGKFNPIAGAVQKYDGTADYGGGDASMADIVGDAGQVILAAAARSTTRAHISVKVTRPDTAVVYLDVLVTSWALSAAKENTPYTRKCHIEICLAPVYVAAS